jgi:ATP-binding cassette subfamily B protein/subfamily B ATP-binding cassette protein MsbA
MNFYKVVRMALRAKFAFAASVVCALIVAALWGLNIGAIYPVVEVFSKGDSMQDWVRGEIAAAEKTAKQQADDLVVLRKQLAAAPADADAEQRRLRARIATAEAREQVETAAITYYAKLQWWIDRYCPKEAFSTLVLAIVVIFAGTLLKDFFLISNSILVAWIAHSATFNLSKLFYRRTLRMDLATFGDDGTADLMSRFTNDMNQVAGGIDTLLGKMVREPLKMIACLVGAGWVNWRLLLLSLVIAPISAVAIRWLSKTLKRANRRAMEGMAVIYTTLEETFRSIKIVKAFTNERQERNRYHKNAKHYLRKAMKIAAYDSLVHPMTEIMGIFSVCLALSAGAWIVINNSTHLLGLRLCDRPMDYLSLLLFFGLLAGVADPLRKLSDVFSRLQAAGAACDRIFARLEREPKVRNPRHPVFCPRHSKSLEFENVNFSYIPGKQVLDGVNLTIRAGETIAVVGPNGSGKSTLAHLIPRFADPASGEIRLDGTPINQVRLRDLRRQIGIVTQETLLFDDTIFNNIRYGSPHATREQVIAAAKQAHAHRFIEKELPDGYDTMAGALGGKLSGGQRQRISLARAILRDPSIMILDEATSQVDLESEQAIQKVLETFVRGRTTIIITHRLAILALADRIVVMQDGRIEDVGRHEELAARCGLYQRLYKIHFEDLRQTA